jgi:GAF domain-containing protein
LKTFADQAVIAIENVRLFTELQTRNLEIVDKSRQLEVASLAGRACTARDASARGPRLRVGSIGPGGACCCSLPCSSCS